MVRPGGRSRCHARIVGPAAFGSGFRRDWKSSLYRGSDDGSTIGAAYAVFRLLFDGCMEKIGLGAEGAAGGVSFARECAVAGLLALVFTGLVQGL